MAFIKSALLASAVLLATNTVASAAVVSFSTTFGPLRTDFTTGSLILQSFDSSLGTLTGVQFSLMGSGNFAGTVTNRGSSAETFTLNESTTLSISSATAGLSGLATSFSSGQTFTNLAAGASANFGPFSPANTVTANPTNLAAFQSGPLSFTAGTVTGISTTGGGGNVTTSFDTFASGVVAVAYTYNAPSTAVPEPASMALLGVGMVGLGLVRRRKV